jgi:heterodisulfide reductase subunit A
MVSVGRHENIKLLSYSEVESVSGYVGNFTVQVVRKPRYVNEDTCTGCGTCIEKCPWKKIPSEFDMGLGNRPAIYFLPAGSARKPAGMCRTGYLQKGNKLRSSARLAL